MNTTTKHNIRWLIRRDMDEINCIEHDHQCGLSEETIRGHLKQRNCIGIVAESPDGPIDGYAIYTLHPSHFRLERIAVHRMCHRSGVGKAMVERLKERCSFKNERRNAIEVDVPEINLAAQLFFQSCGFRAIGCDGDMIAFRFEI